MKCLYLYFTDYIETAVLNILEHYKLPWHSVMLTILPDAASPLTMLGVSKKEHSFSGILSCQESVFNTLMKSDLRFPGSLV